MTSQEWIPALFSAIDARDADTFADHLAPDVLFQFANAPPVVGVEAVRDAVAGFFASIAGIRHELAEVWDMGDAVICRGVVTYTRHDGSGLEVPFANIFRMNGERIREYRIFVDASQLREGP